MGSNTKANDRGCVTASELLYCDVSRVPGDTVQLFDDLQGNVPSGKI